MKKRVFLGMILCSACLQIICARDFVKTIPYASPTEIWSRYGTPSASNRSDGYGWTPLMIAAGKHDNPEAVATLLRAGARLESASIEGWTPLMFAAAFNANPLVTAELLRHGADPNARTIDAWSAMTTAARFLEQQTFVRNIAAGRDPEAKQHGLTPLMLAARFSSSPEVITLLVENGGEVNAVDEYHLSPLLHAARYNDNSEVIETLLTLGADPKQRCFGGNDYQNYLSKE